MKSIAVFAPLLAILVTAPAATEALPFPDWFSSLISPRATVCNGFADACSRSFSNFTFIGTHDSYAISSSNLAANQDVSITAQLNAGIRMLQSQAHRSENRTTTGAGIDLCHQNCALFQGGALENYLSEVKRWSDQNPNEVISLLIVNSDSLPASQFAQAFESTGLAAKAYRPGKITGIDKSEWPTLGSLIDAGTPVVAFLASYADDSVPYLIDEFTNMFENDYNQLSTPFNCAVDRISRGYNPNQMMYLSNHYLDVSVLGSTTVVIPDKKNMFKTNSQSAVVSGAQSCAAIHNNALPNFILVDFFNTPQRNGPLQAAAQLNGLSWSSNSTGVPRGSISYAGQDSTGSGSGNSGTGSGGSGGNSAAGPSVLFSAAPAWNVALLGTSLIAMAVGTLL